MTKNKNIDLRKNILPQTSYAAFRALVEVRDTTTA